AAWGRLGRRKRLADRRFGGCRDHRSAVARLARHRAPGALSGGADQFPALSPHRAVLRPPRTALRAKAVSAAAAADVSGAVRPYLGCRLPLEKKKLDSEPQLP